MEPSLNRKRQCPSLVTSNSKRRRVSTLPDPSDASNEFIPHMSIEEVNNLQINDKIDHRNKNGKFVKAIIINKIGSKCYIHYEGEDETHTITSDCIQRRRRFAKYGSISSRPAGSRLAHLSIESPVDINPLLAHPGWTCGTIQNMDDESGQVQVKVYNVNNLKSYWTHLDNSDEIDIYGIKSNKSSTYQETERKTERVNNNLNEKRKIIVKPKKKSEIENDGNIGWEKYKQQSMKDTKGEIRVNDENSNSNQKSGLEINDDSKENRRNSKSNKRRKSSINGQNQRKKSESQNNENLTKKKRKSNTKKRKSDTNGKNDKFANNELILTSYDIIKWLNKIEDGRFMTLKFKKLKEFIKNKNINIFQISNFDNFILETFCDINNVKDIQCILSKIKELIQRQSEQIFKIHKNEDYLNRNNNIPSEYICPLSLELMIDPCCTSESGQSYQRTALENYIKINGKDPWNGKETKINDIIANRTLKSLILKWIQQNK